MANGNGLQNSIISVIALGALAYVGTEAVKSMDLSKTNKENITQLIASDLADEASALAEYKLLEIKLQLHKAEGHEHIITRTIVPDDQQGDPESSNEIIERFSGQQ